MNIIKKYNDQAAYAATERDATEPHVSLVGQDVVIDGCNVIVPLKRGLAMPGDHLYFDLEAGSYVLIRQQGYKKTAVDTTRYVDGKAVYFGDMGDKAYFVGVESLGSKAFSQYSRCKLTGFDLENGGTAKLTASSFACEFTYSAGATYAEIVTAMTAAKTGDYKSYVSFAALSDGVAVYTWPVVSVASGGLTLTWLKAVKADGTEVDCKVAWDTLANYCNLTEIGYNALDLRGLDGTGRLHKAQYTEYIRTLNSATTFGDEQTQFMNQATFNSCADGTVGGADGIALYNKYNGDWYAYADVCAGIRMIDFDAPYKTAETLRDGIVATKELAGVTIVDFDESVIPAFPGADAANKYGITTTGATTGFEAGNWHQIGVGELARIMKLATSRTTTLDANDVINKAIIAAGGTGIYGNTTYQLCGASNVYYQLIFGGTYGNLRNNNRIGSTQVRVALALNY